MLYKATKALHPPLMLAPLELFHYHVHMRKTSPIESAHHCILLALAKGPLFATSIHHQIFIDSRSSAVYVQLSTLCKMLKRLESQRFVKHHPDPQTGRTVYELTRLGQRILKAETYRLEEAVHLAKQRILF
jgi:DNA-binding PadR family transcriptional regulator